MTPNSWIGLAFLIGFVFIGWLLKPKRKPVVYAPLRDVSLGRDQHTADRQAHVHELQQGFRRSKGRQA